MNRKDEKSVMADFTGAKCEYCKKVFTPSDDVVVCPDCGTPYHRECYFEAGECINHELHERGGDWEQFYSDRVEFSNNDDSVTEIRCPRCGTENPKSGLFCVKCGMPLNSNQEARPFNNPYGNNGNPYGNNQNPMGGGMFGQQPFVQPQTIDLKEVDIDGHKGEKYGRFAKKNFLYYVATFFNFSKNKIKTSFSIPAVLFPEYFFFYRKMFLLGTLMLIFSSIVSVPVMIVYILDGMFEGITLPQIFYDKQAIIADIATVCSFIRMVVCIVCGLFANYWYFLKAKKTLTEIDNMDINEEQKNELISQKGGTSGIALVISVTANVVLVMLALIGLVAYFR